MTPYYDEDGITTEQAIRSAITTHLAPRRADAEFQRRLRRRMFMDRRVLQRIAAGPDDD